MPSKPPTDARNLPWTSAPTDTLPAKPRPSEADVPPPARVVVQQGPAPAQKPTKEPARLLTPAFDLQPQRVVVGDPVTLRGVVVAPWVYPPEVHISQVDEHGDTARVALCVNDARDLVDFLTAWLRLLDGE